MLDYARKDGSTLRDTLEALFETTGFLPPELADEPVPPEGYDHVLNAFWLLNSSSGGQPVSYREMLAFQELDGTQLSPLDCEIIVKLSAAYQRELHRITRGSSE
jgi:hypothetical protein